MALVIADKAADDLAMWCDVDGAFAEIKDLLDSLESGRRIATAVGNGDPRLTVSSENFVVLCRRLSPRDDPRAMRHPIYLIARIISMQEVKEKQREELKEKQLATLVITKKAEADLEMWHAVDDEAFEEMRDLIDSLESGRQVATVVRIGDPRLTVSSENFVVLCRRLSPRDDPRAMRQPVYLIARIISMQEVKEKQRELPSSWVEEYKGWNY